MIRPEVCPEGAGCAVWMEECKWPTRRRGRCEGEVGLGIDNCKLKISNLKLENSDWRTHSVSLKEQT